MRLPSLRWAIWFAAAGIVVALACFGLLQISIGWSLYAGVVALRVVCVLWPFSVSLLATAGIEGTFEAWTLVAMAIAANGILYGIGGGMVSMVRPRRKGVAAGHPRLTR